MAEACLCLYFTGSWEAWECFMTWTDPQTTKGPWWFPQMPIQIIYIQIEVNKIIIRFSMVEQWSTEAQPIQDKFSYLLLYLVAASMSTPPHSSLSPTLLSMCSWVPFYFRYLMSPRESNIQLHNHQTFTMYPINVSMPFRPLDSLKPVTRVFGTSLYSS